MWIRTPDVAFEDDYVGATGWSHYYVARKFVKVRQISEDHIAVPQEAGPCGGVRHCYAVVDGLFIELGPAARCESSENHEEPIVRHRCERIARSGALRYPGTIEPQYPMLALSHRRQVDCHFARP